MISPSLVLTPSDFSSDPQVVVPASASRYELPASIRPAAVKAPAAQTPLPSERELDTWLGLSKQAENAGSAAAFAVHELPELELRAQRAVADDDPDELSAVTARIDDAVTRFGSALTPWAYLQGAGPMGQEVSRRVNQVLSKRYKHEWGMNVPGKGARTVSMVQDDWTDENVARRTRRVAKDLDVSEAAARAMFDRRADNYPVYSMFAGLLDKGNESQQNNPLVQTARMNQTAYLHAVQKLETEYGKRFSGSSDMAEFVKAFDVGMNKDGKMSSDDSLLMSVADSFLGQRSKANGIKSATRFVNQYNELVKGLIDPKLLEDPGEDKPATGEQTLRRRMAVHEAQTLATAFTNRAAELGVQDRVVTGQFRDSLANAAFAARRLNEIYGIDPYGEPGGAANIAELALARLGVPGARAGFMSQVDEVVARASQFASSATRKTVQMKQTDRGDVIGRASDGSNPYFQTELSLMNKVGAALWRASRTNRGDVSTATSRAMTEGTDENKMVFGALVDALSPRFFGDRRLAEKVASDMMGNLDGTSGAPKMTLEKALRSRAIPASAAETGGVPPDRVLSVGGGITSNDVGLLARGEAIQSERGNEAIRGAQRQLARAISKHDAEKSGEAREKDFDYQKAVGDLYATVSGDADYLLRTGLLGKMAATDHFNDKKHTTVIRAAVRGLATFAADENQPRAERAEAMAKLMIVMASGYDPDPVPLRSLANPESLDPTWKKVRSTARSMGVYLPPRREQYVKSKPDLTKLIEAVPEIAESNLAKSGYLNIHTGHLDAKNMLRVQQENTYRDPQKIKGNGGKGGDELSDEQKSAQRVLATFETEESDVGRAMNQYRMHLMRTGLDRDTVSGIEGSAFASLSDAWNNGGAPAVARQLQKLTSRNIYYLPEIARVQNPGGKGHHYAINPEKVRLANNNLPLTAAEWEDEKAKFRAQYKRLVGKELDEGYLDGFQPQAVGKFQNMMFYYRAKAKAQAAAEGRAAGQEPE